MAEDVLQLSVTDDPEVAALRVPPHSIQAELSVLGAVFLDKEVWIEVSEQLQESDFYRADHQHIFNAMSDLDRHGEPIDILIVGEWLERHGQLDAIGGMSRLAEIAESTPGSSNIAAYIGIVRKRSILRKLISATNEIVSHIFNPEGKNAEEIIDYAEQIVFEIAEHSIRGRSTYTDIQDLVSSTLDRIDALQKAGNPITGVATGYTDLDMRTAGLQKSDLIIIAGRPSMGKTALAVNIIEHAVIKEQLSVAMFSMEMPGEQLSMRMLGSLSRVNQQHIRTGKLRDEDWTRLASVLSLLSDAKLMIDDTPALTPAELRARCRRMARQKNGLDLVVVDYMQLMQIPTTKENRATEIAEISRSMKAMAKELNVPVIALSQLNRSLEQRPNKRPVMSDLRESGAIEQDADLILFIYRDEIYDDNSADKGIAEIIIAKQRNGPIGTVKLSFLGEYTRFENYAESDIYSDGVRHDVALPPDH